MKNSIIENNLYVLKLINKASPARIPLSFLSILLSVGSNFLFNIYLLRLVINAIQNQTPFQEIVNYIIIVGAVLVAYCLFNNYLMEVYVPKSNRKIYEYIQKKVYQKAQSVDISCYHDPVYYDKYMRAINESVGVAHNALNILCGWFANILTIFSVSLMIFIIDPIFILFSAIPVAYTLLLGKKLNKLNFDRHIEIADKTRKRDYIKRVFYLSDYSKEIRLTAISNVLLKRYFTIIEDLKCTIKKHGKKIAVIDYFSIVLQHVFLFIGSIIYVTYRTVVVGNMLFGDCVIVVNNIVSTSSALKGVVDGYMNLHANSLSIKSIREFWDYEPQIKQQEDSEHVPHGDMHLSLKNVTFSYGDAHGPVLEKISLDIRSGEKIALVGHNGAGKTTLIKLLLRFYDPNIGEIQLNGKNIKKYKLYEYRKIFGTIFQQYKVFSMSVLENVVLHDPITCEEREMAIYGMKSSGIFEKIEQLPHLEDTILTKEFDSNGAILSGGENQKIAISRVFAKRCEIVIMDEPSSALDPIAESKMYEAMMLACKEKAVIYISHRLSSAVLADRIYLLENGKIIEQGSHQELLEQNGVYSHMWNIQAQQYLTGEQT